MIWTTFARRTLANVCLLVAFHSLAAPGRCQDNLAWKSTTMNGVKLEFTATQLGPFDDPTIRVQWKMSYIGERLPCVILKPSLEAKTSATTFLEFSAQSKLRNKRGSVKFESPPMEIPPPILGGAFCAGFDFGPKGRPRKIDFVVLKKDAVYTEQFDVKRSKLEKQFREQMREEFDIRPLTISAFFRHLPWERGEEFNFDAWTGSLVAGSIDVVTIDNDTKKKE
jgi:hypothetical protein